MVPPPPRPHETTDGVPVRQWISPDRRIQVVLLRQRDGFWSLGVWRYCLNCLGEFPEWEGMTPEDVAPLVNFDVYEEWEGGTGGSIYDSIETALRDLLLAFPWIKDVPAEELNSTP